MQYEHKCRVIETSTFMRRGIVKPREIEKQMQRWAKDGFELVSVVPVSDGSVGTSRIALFFKRAVEMAG